MCGSLAGRVTRGIFLNSQYIAILPFGACQHCEIKKHACVRSLPPQAVAVLPDRYHLRPLLVRYNTYGGVGVSMRGGVSTSIAIYKVYHAEVLSCFCRHKSDEHHVRVYTHHRKILHVTLILQDRKL